MTRVKLKSLLSILVNLFFLVAPSDAFFRHLCHGELGNGRVDPIIAPGKPSSHVHVMFGASSECHPLCATSRSSGNKS